MINQKTLHSLIEKSKQLVVHVPHNNQHHFSFLLRKNKVISFSWNAPSKTHPLSYKFNREYPFLHAEASCLISSCYIPSYDKYVLVNVRIGKDGMVRLSKPCECCQKLIESFGIKKVFFTNDNGEFEFLN